MTDLRKIGERIKRNVSDRVYIARTNANTKKQGKIADEMRKHNQAIVRETNKPSQYAAMQKQLSKGIIKNLAIDSAKVAKKQQSLNKKYGY